jgi:hypothetical protein
MTAVGSGEPVTRLLRLAPGLMPGVPSPPIPGAVRLHDPSCQSRSPGAPSDLSYTPPPPELPAPAPTLGEPTRSLHPRGPGFSRKPEGGRELPPTGRPGRTRGAVDESP